MYVFVYVCKFDFLFCFAFMIISSWLSKEKKNPNPQLLINIFQSNRGFGAWVNEG